jgi:hypothetical protein
MTLASFRHVRERERGDREKGERDERKKRERERERKRRYASSNDVCSPGISLTTSCAIDDFSPTHVGSSSGNYLEDARCQFFPGN